MHYTHTRRVGVAGGDARSNEAPDRCVSGQAVAGSVPSRARARPARSARPGSSACPLRRAAGPLSSRDTGGQTWPRGAGMSAVQAVPTRFVEAVLREHLADGDASLNDLVATH